MIKKQHGVTLIELMVSMMLGLALISGLSQLFVQSQKSFTLQRNLSDMTDDGVFVLEALSKSILLASFVYTGDKNELTASTVFKTDFKAGEYVKGTIDNSALIYRFKLHSSAELDNSICTNAGLSVTGTSPNVFLDSSIISVKIYIEKEYGTQKNLYQTLKCDTNPDSNAKPLISQVEKLVFRYGIHNKAAGTFFYTTATNVDAIDQATTKNNWQNVFAVKVFLVMRSADDNLTKNKAKYKIEDKEYTATDNRLYKVFSKTIFLRNAP